LNRTDGRGIEDLYVLGMDELLAKDAAFFHENFAGSLTKRVHSFAARFEEFVDTIAFQVIANIVPLAFASVVLWRYDPLLVAVLLAAGLAGGELGVAAIVVVFTYFTNATRLMFDFNQIYRRLESSLTEAAQFTELLLTPPTVLDPRQPEALRPSGAEIRFER